MIFSFPDQIARAALLSLSLLAAAPVFAQSDLSFTCATAKPSVKVTPLTADTRYQATATNGFDLVASPTDFSKGACSSDKPFFFSASVPDGNYRVSLTLGSSSASTITVRAESRRLFVDRMQIPAGGSRQVIFNVNVRTADIHSANAEPRKVKLKPREIGALDWDEKLTLEFNGINPGVRAISIKPTADIPTVYLAGDSTVVDQDKEPWAAWGQMLPVFFGPGISIANEAESGETIKSFVGELRYDKVMSTIRPGDYLMIQFAHNDQKPGSGYVPAMTDYKTYLRRYIADARAHRAFPILVTSMNRRTFDAQGKITASLGDYPQAMREMAVEQKVPLIDLNAMSKTLYEAMGDAGTLKAFVHYPANTFPGQTEELKDDTHFNSYGAYELARAIVQNIRDQKLALAPYLRKDIPPFNPAHPDSVATFSMPQSPLFSIIKPDGR
jgi:lysophospholipase L1-like esterase